MQWWGSSCYANSPPSHPHRLLCQDAAALVLLKIGYYCYKNNHFCFLQTGTCAGSSSNSFRFLCDTVLINFYCEKCLPKFFVIRC